MSKGLLVIISGPSGSGKTSLVEGLVSDPSNTHIVKAVTATTRYPRPNEVDGVHYHFLSREKFEQLVDEDQFLEHAEFSGHLYGSPVLGFKPQLENGKVVLMILDTQGAISARSSSVLDDDNFRTTYIFVLPPSLEELRHRLGERGDGSDEDIARRLSVVKTEVERLWVYNNLLINSRLEDTISDAKSIIYYQKNFILTGEEGKWWLDGGILGAS